MVMAENDMYSRTSAKPYRQQQSLETAAVCRMRSWSFRVERRRWQRVLVSSESGRIQGVAAFTKEKLKHTDEVHKCCTYIRISEITAVVL